MVKMSIFDKTNDLFEKYGKTKLYAIIIGNIVNKVDSSI